MNIINKINDFKEHMNEYIKPDMPLNYDDLLVISQELDELILEYYRQSLVNNTTSFK